MKYVSAAWAWLRLLAARLAFYFDGTKTYLGCVGEFVYVMYQAHWKITGPVMVHAGLDALIAFFRAISWKPGGLSNAVTLPQPDGGSIVVKPPPQ